MQSDLQTIAQGPTLRVAINLGNRALAVEENGELHGITPQLGKRLAREIGKPVEFVIFHGAGKTFAAATKGVWDVAFLAIDPIRARAVSFTRPYKEIVATYAVRSESAITSVDQADRPGHKIVVAADSAYDLYLQNALQHAELIRAGDPVSSFDVFRAGTGDLVGGVLQSLQRNFPAKSGIRILPGRITAVQQAMVLPGPEADAIAALDDFVARAIDDGFVADH